MMLPQMQISTYSTFGQYILGARTMGEEISRGFKSLPYHSIGDKLALVTDGDEARFSYKFALAGHPGYQNVSCFAAGVLLSLCKSYTAPDWRAIRVELDVPKPRRAALFEDLFQCPTVFGAPTTTIIFDKQDLETERSYSLRKTQITLNDVVRDRRLGAPRDLIGAIREPIRIQMIGGEPKLENVVRSIDSSMRTLQRELNRNGVSFRSLLKRVRLERAQELLVGTQLSITEIAFELGYTIPSYFTRHFRSVVGVSPGGFRVRCQAM